MPSSRGAAFRKLCRWLHRDLSFFFAGMVLIYALSGLFMNHRNDIDPQYTVRRTEFRVADNLPGKEGMTRERVLELLRPLDAIRPYRLEGDAILPGGDEETRFAFWQQRLTDLFLDKIRADDGLLRGQRIRRLGIGDAFVEHGTQAQLRELVGLRAPDIIRAVRELVLKG